MKITVHIVAILCLSLLVFSCNRVKDKTMEMINKGGETAGKTATEFFEGVTEGVDKTLQCEVSVSQTLKEKGLRTGKFSIESDSLDGRNNVFTVYLIFDKDFNGPITAFTFDKNGAENGRSTLQVEGESGEARFVDFYFDKRTYIEAKSKIMLQ
jgi:hypothetical protein